MSASRPWTSFRTVGNKSLSCTSYLASGSLPQGGRRRLESLSNPEDAVFVLGQIQLTHLQSVFASVCRFLPSAVNRKTTAKFSTKPSNPLSYSHPSPQLCLFLPLHLRWMYNSGSTFECHFIKFLKQPAYIPKLTVSAGEYKRLINV